MSVGQSTRVAPQPTNPRFRVLTLNLMQKSPVADRGERFDTIAKFLKARQDEGRPVDALLLQEGCSGVWVGTTDSLNDLRARLAQRGMNYDAHSEPCFGVRPFLLFRVGVLSTTKALYTDGRALECRTGDGFDDAPLPGRKRVVMVGIDHPIGRVSLFSTHLCSGGKMEDRRRQAEELVQFVRDASTKHPANLTVLGGDMNTQPDTELHRLLTADFSDSHVMANPNLPGHTFNLSGNPHCRNYRGHPRRIDFLFFKGDNVAVESSEVVFSSDGQWVSDHCGVLSTFHRTK